MSDLGGVAGEAGWVSDFGVSGYSRPGTETETGTETGAETSGDQARGCLGGPAGGQAGAPGDVVEWPPGEEEAGEGLARTRESRLRLAGALRRITRSLVSSELPDGMLARVAGQAEGLADDLESATGPVPLTRKPPDITGPPQEFFPTSPVIGYANPIAVPVEVEIVGAEVRGRVVFTEAYEGPPTCVHGGVIAMVFDELLGAANIAAGHPGMTGTLTVRYRRPTPLRAELSMAARFVEKTGRKIRTTGEIYHGTTLTAEAEGIFVEVLPERFRELAEGHLGEEATARAGLEAERIGLTRPA
jgi:acyl-coenzyme A thioesterase PaaI-like protein